jgi:hypothetical protein
MRALLQRIDRLDEVEMVASAQRSRREVNDQQLCDLRHEAAVSLTGVQDDDQQTGVNWSAHHNIE